jgi:mono/diheme cytochrome c family protein
MPGAVGAVGAGAYPALAGNPKLEVAGYPVSIIMNGQKAMPALGPYLNDAQIADVVNYIRTHFGNSYTDKVTAAEIKTMR